MLGKCKKNCIFLLLSAFYVGSYGDIYEQSIIGYGINFDNKLLELNNIQDVLRQDNTPQTKGDFTWKYGVAADVVPVIYSTSSVNASKKEFYKVAYPVIQEFTLDGAYSPKCVNFS